MSTGKYELLIKWPSGQSTLAGEITDGQYGEMCRVLSPDYSAQAQAAPEAEPVGHVYTMQPCFPGEPMQAHAQLHKALPAGTKLYASPQHDAELVELLRDQMTWHEARDKELSKSGRSDADYHWRRLQHQEQIALIDAKLATLSAKNEGGKV